MKILLALTLTITSLNLFATSCICGGPSYNPSLGCSQSSCAIFNSSTHHPCIIENPDSSYNEPWSPLGLCANGMDDNINLTNNTMIQIDLSMHVSNEDILISPIEDKFYYRKYLEQKK